MHGFRKRDREREKEREREREGGRERERKREKFIYALHKASDNTDKTSFLKSMHV